MTCDHLAEAERARAAAVSLRKERVPLNAAHTLAVLWTAPVAAHSNADYVRARILDWPELREALDTLALACGASIEKGSWWNPPPERAP